VHWGATSQDVIDTGLVLQIREGLELIERQVNELISELAEIAERHASTLMPGRTWLQHAVPITFGFKAAGWLDAMLRHQTRLAESRSRVLTLQLGGAAGTLASLGADGEAVANGVAARLGLNSPEMSWHSSRDRLGELSAMLGLIVGTLGKIARDVSLLMQSEVGEVFEAGGEGRGGSSTMPQKRNPVACSTMLAAAERVPGLVATMLASMSQEHERGIGNWQAEWETLPQIFNLCSGSLDRAIEVVAGIEVDEQRMLANLELTNGLIYAERISMALARTVGKEAAHALVERACNQAIASRKHLREALLEDADFMKHMTEQALLAQFDGAAYLGSSQESVSRVVARARKSATENRTSMVEIPGVRLNIAVSGLPKNPVLVFSNSLGADLSMWDAQLAEFSKHFRVLSYDTRGHGSSSTPAGPCTIEQMGLDLLALLDKQEIESCFFCGLSMGGMIGQWLAINAASRVKRIALCNTAAKIGTSEGWNARIAAIDSAGMQAVVPGILERLFTPEFSAAHRNEIAETRETLLKANREGYIACCAAIRDADFRDDVAGIRTPTLVIGGTHDVATPPAECRALAAAIPGAEYVELNAAHLSNIEAAVDFNSAVVKFLLG
jgi:3-carboxy-cis,cis-muconate cycloisomerase/3-oxoadipate enol-lactonase